MTGFDSKRQMAQDKLQDDADTLSIVYQRGFADGKKAAQPEQEQEPVAWMKEDWTGGHLNYECVYERAFAAFPVYKHPPAAQRKPLTEEMRKQMLEVSDNYERRGAFANGWLSAEAAHNIKQQP
jgi:hypothetical protein